MIGAVARLYAVVDGHALGFRQPCHRRYSVCEGVCDSQNVNPVVPLPPVRQRNSYRPPESVAVTGPSDWYARFTFVAMAHDVVALSIVIPFPHLDSGSPFGAVGESLHPGSGLDGESEQPGPVFMPLAS